MKNKTFTVEIDENGHDLQCSSSVGGKCDCWRDPKIRKASEEAIKKQKGKPIT